MKKFLYETHLHTAPVSKCGKATPEESVDYYKELGYDGIFVTNHFIDGNINISGEASYEEKINFYCSDFEKAEAYGKKVGLKVFFGFESSFFGTDFLVYGLDKKWLLEHPEIETMEKREELEFFIENGALVVQAHPFREAGYIDHIRLFPRSVQGVEVINAGRDDFTNNLAKIYCEQYGLIGLAGSDNHGASEVRLLAGVSTDEPINSVEEFMEKVFAKDFEIFSKRF